MVRRVCALAIAVASFWFLIFDRMDRVGVFATDPYVAGDLVILLGVFIIAATAVGYSASASGDQKDD